MTSVYLEPYQFIKLTLLVSPFFSNVVQKAMETKVVDGRFFPTWKLVDGACRESLAFEVARKEGVPKEVVDRAEELCVTKMLFPSGEDAANQDCSQSKAMKRIEEDDRFETSFNQSFLITSLILN